MTFMRRLIFLIILFISTLVYILLYNKLSFHHKTNRSHLTTFDVDKRNSNITLLNPGESICEPRKQNNVIKLVAFVATRVDSFRERQIVRNTWANPVVYDDTMKVKEPLSHKG